MCPGQHLVVSVFLMLAVPVGVWHFLAAALFSPRGHELMGMYYTEWKAT